MAKNEQPAPVQADVVNTSPEPIKVTLDEFCTRLSEKVTRPELIGAFAFTERHAGNLRDTSEGFAARYEVFINKPV